MGSAGEMIDPAPPMINMALEKDARMVSWYIILQSVNLYVDALVT